MNLFFLLNIVRVLITKLKVTHQAESNLYMKAVRATLILVPLLGIEFVLIPWRPEGKIAEEIYDYTMHILMHFQVGVFESGRQLAKSGIKFTYSFGFIFDYMCRKLVTNNEFFSIWNQVTLFFFYRVFWFLQFSASLMERYGD